MEGEEVTDTYPPNSISWGRISKDSNEVRVVGIKKSFPSFSNKDYFAPFNKHWLKFARWLVEDNNGKIIIIVRSPVQSILSWKTTFDALRADTETQCIAWKKIASVILETNSVRMLIRYEDLVSDTERLLQEISDYLGVESSSFGRLPAVENLSLEEYLFRKKIKVADIRKDLELIKKICGDEASRLGYVL